jgi:hypothetical protein
MEVGQSEDKSRANDENEDRDSDRDKNRFIYLFIYFSLMLATLQLWHISQNKSQVPKHYTGFPLGAIPVQVSICLA